MPEANELIGGRYRLGPAIGTGGMGTVHRARDLRFERDVAIKLVRTAADPRHQERLRREARLLGALQHPNLVAAYDTGIDLTPDGPVLWLAMELLRGPDLGALLASHGRLADEDVRQVLHDAAAALAALHSAGIVHRDLKPANILLTGEPGSGPWHAKVADLGIALAEDATAMTTTGQVMGTAAYLSPEQVSASGVTAASDIYSLGLLALVALTGEHPFPGGPVESATARLVRPPAIPAWVTGEWRALLEAMTALEPALRPTAEQVVDATSAPLPALVAGRPPAALAAGDLPTVLASAPLPTAVLPLAEQSAAPLAGWRRPGTLTIAAAAVLLGLAAGGAALVATTSAAPGTTRTASPAPTPVAARHSATPSSSVRPVTTTARPSTTARTVPRPPQPPQPPNDPGKKGKDSEKGPGRPPGHDGG